MHQLTYKIQPGQAFQELPPYSQPLPDSHTIRHLAKTEQHRTQSEILIARFQNKSIGQTKCNLKYTRREPFRVLGS